MPWLKEIILDSGESRRFELKEDSEFVINRGRRKPNPLALKQMKGSVRVFAESTDAGTVWRAMPQAFSDVSKGVAPEDAFGIPQGLQGAHALSHGSMINSGDRAFIFLDRMEARNDALEEAATTSDENRCRWVDWLNDQNDPYAEPLRAMLAGKEFGGRERWWLEGIDRGIHSPDTAFEMRHGFLRRVVLRGSPLPIDLQLLHLLSLRVSRAIEELTVDLPNYVVASYWRPFGLASFWSKAPWPDSLLRLRLSAPRPGDVGVSGCIEMRECVEGVQRALPNIHIEG